MLGTVDFEARCMAAQTLGQLGDASIKIVSKAEYDSTEHESNTIYYVQDGDKIVQYVGDTKLTSGSIAGVSSLAGQAIRAIVGTATLDPDTVEEVENT